MHIAGTARAASPTPPSKPRNRSSGSSQQDRREQHRRPDEPARERDRQPAQRRCSAHADSAPMTRQAEAPTRTFPPIRRRRSSPATSHMNARNAAAHAKPAHCADGCRDPAGGHERGPADPLRDGARKHEDAEQRRGVQADPESVRSLQRRGVGRQHRHHEEHPSTAKTPQVRRHQARPRPERAYPPASPNVTTPIAPPPIPWVISSLKIVGSASAARNRHGERASHRSATRRSGAGARPARSARRREGPGRGSARRCRTTGS